MVVDKIEIKECFGSENDEQIVLGKENEEKKLFDIVIDERNELQDFLRVEEL